MYYRLSSFHNGAVPLDKNYAGRPHLYKNMYVHDFFSVSDGPQFRAKPHSIQADLGASVTLSCDVDGNPFPDISWFHEDNPKVVSTSPNLTIRVDSDTAGRYYCKAHVSGFPDIGTEAAVYLKGHQRKSIKVEMFPNSILLQDLHQS